MAIAALTVKRGLSKGLIDKVAMHISYLWVKSTCVNMLAGAIPADCQIK